MNDEQGLRFFTRSSFILHRSYNVLVTVQSPTVASAESAPSFTLNDLLIYMAKQQASDLHLKPMRPPLLRIRGKLVPVKSDPLKPADLEKMLLPLLNRVQKDKFEALQSVDFGYGVAGVARFRANVYMQRGTVGAVFRRVPINIQSIDALELPDAIRDLTQIPDGLVLVTGPTGSGKSTTLAAMISHIGETEPLHIVTIEDPIEFLFIDKVAAISQREVGTDTPNFREALRNAMRQDPDVIMVGEMSDSGDGGDRADGGRDRPPRLLHAPHQQRRADHRPHHRHLPGRSAQAGPLAAGPRPSRHRLAEAHQDHDGHPDGGGRDPQELAAHRQTDRRRATPRTSSRRWRARSGSTGCSR